jgi:hypothetical protein
VQPSLSQQRFPADLISVLGAPEVWWHQDGDNVLSLNQYPRQDDLADGGGILLAGLRMLGKSTGSTSRRVYGSLRPQCRQGFSAGNSVAILILDRLVITGSHSGR